MEHWYNDTGTGKQKYHEENMSLCLFSHDKSEIPVRLVLNPYLRGQKQAAWTKARHMLYLLKFTWYETERIEKLVLAEFSFIWATSSEMSTLNSPPPTKMHSFLHPTLFLSVPRVQTFLPGTLNPLKSVWSGKNFSDENSNFYFSEYSSNPLA
jgi:hypothetical protein